MVLTGDIGQVSLQRHMFLRKYKAVSNHDLGSKLLLYQTDNVVAYQAANLKKLEA